MNTIDRVKYEARTKAEWISYINCLKSPKSDIERTRNHYLCLNIKTSVHKKILINILSALVIPVSFIVTCIYSFFFRFKQYEDSGCDAVEFVIQNGSTYPSKVGIPDCLAKEYPVIKPYIQKKGKALFFTGIMNKSVLKIWCETVRKYPFSFLMNLSVLTHILSINKLIAVFHPKAIISTEAENDYTSSILSSFCEKKGIEYICIMHGEYILTPGHAFVRFSRFYVWEDYYIKQFTVTRSDPNFFYLYHPNRFSMDLQNREKRYFITYYLQDQTETQLRNIFDSLEKIANSGKKCAIRMHPRQTDKLVVNTILPEYHLFLEDESQTTIAQSFSDTEYVVSAFSTVLSEAYENGKKVAIDDVSDKELFDSLKELMYYNARRITTRLSDLVTEYS